MGEAYNIIWNMAHAVWPAASAAAHRVGGKLNGSFPAALFGALGGSYSAYLLGVRNDRRNKLREEIAATNNAIGMTNNVINVMLSLKGQHINLVADHYGRQFQEYFDFVVAPQAIGQGPRELVLRGDFRIINPPYTTIEYLQRTIIERVTRSPAAQMLIASLQRSLQTLERTLDQRTRLISQMQQVPEDVRVLLYLGLPHPNGSVDDTYPDTMTAMVAYIDDSLYFCDLLLEILVNHGAALRKAYGRSAPKILKLDMADPRIAPLMPDRSLYPDFELQFRAPEKPGRWARIWAWVSRPFAEKT